MTDETIMQIVRTVSFTAVMIMCAYAVERIFGSGSNYLKSRMELVDSMQNTIVFQHQKIQTIRIMLTQIKKDSDAETGKKIGDLLELIEFGPKQLKEEFERREAANNN